MKEYYVKVLSLILGLLLPQKLTNKKYIQTIFSWRVFDTSYEPTTYVDVGDEYTLT